MTDNRYLILVYWVLTYGMGGFFLLAIFAYVKAGPGRAGHSLVGLILIGLEALIWCWISTEGGEMIEWL